MILSKHTCRVCVVLFACQQGFAQANPVSAALSPANEPTSDAGTTTIESTMGTTPVKSLPNVPALPKGRATSVGGSVRSVDHVRDALTIRVFGGRDMKVLFDARTQVYRDGQRSSVRDLRPGDHVSLETMLDGSVVFARSIHMLSESPEGDCHGQVIAFDRSKNELVVRDEISASPIRLRLAADVSVAGKGQETGRTVADLVPGTLISVAFHTDNGKGTASRITILAAPGSSFVFSGQITFLDLHSGRMGVLDPRDQQRYVVSFDPNKTPIGADIREGTDVSVNAAFDGQQYVATAIRSTTANP